MRSRLLAVTLGALCLVAASCTDDDDGTTSTTTAPRDDASTTSAAPATGPVTFTLTIENVSDGAATPTPLAPGLVLLHAPGSQPIFTPGLPAGGAGLESLAEDGDPTALAAAIGAETFQAEEGGYEAGPLQPGSSFVVEIVAEPGQVLSFANMFGQSNDWFFASVPDGIALFDEDGVPVDGDVTGSVALWDAGTEVDQPIGAGPDQAPRQAAPNTGDTDPDDLVRKVDSARKFVRVTISPKAAG